MLDAELSLSSHELVQQMKNYSALWGEQRRNSDCEISLYWPNGPSVFR